MIIWILRINNLYKVFSYSTTMGRHEQYSVLTCRLKWLILTACQSNTRKIKMYSSNKCGWISRGSEYIKQTNRLSHLGLLNVSSRCVGVNLKFSRTVFLWFTGLKISLWRNVVSFRKFTVSTNLFPWCEHFCFFFHACAFSVTKFVYQLHGV